MVFGGRGEGGTEGVEGIARNYYDSLIEGSRFRRGWG